VPECGSSSSNSLLFGRFAAHFTAAGKNSYTDYIVFPLPFLVKEFPFSYMFIFVIFFFQKYNKIQVLQKIYYHFRMSLFYFWRVSQTTRPHFVQFAYTKERGG
jgi:hypothetical protein